MAERNNQVDWEARVKEGFKKGNKFGHSIVKPLPATCVAEVPAQAGGTTTAVGHYAREWGWLVVGHP